MISKTTIPARSMLLRGLSEEEVRLRRARGQGNTVKLPTSRSYAQILRENIVTLINLILFALSGALILLGHPLDAVITVGVISFNTLVGIVQEIRAKRSLDRIALLTRPMATVIREGQEHIVDPNALVFGDLFVVRPGDQIVVDGRLVGQGWIDADESLLPAILTGSLAALFVFLVAVALAVTTGLPEATVIATARSSITVFATVCGILLVVFVAPPTGFLAGGNTLRRDWRPTVLATALLGGLTVLLSVSLGRAVFEIAALPLIDIAAIVGVALLWTLLLHFIWRFRLLERVLGMDSERATASDH